ncbi:hypothetical protein F4821DRAFT_277028 [Hypoxylon rubiginosum]|uniref:Uncharacterized protein n=1 Tax=Hypoxylon rubiginosum TaxID=110542 RepID=A0ACC0CI94_9PEZI|nr:hypothetical protein F4821DRAFT_277028 [Hypoxylon rubiginosum]
MERRLIEIRPSEGNLFRTHTLPTDNRTRPIRQKRTSTACFACRRNKTKCAGEPCKRCRNVGLLCYSMARKPNQSLQDGYIDALELNHFRMVKAIEKLYAMIRNGDKWWASEPDMNDRGHPTIYDIVSKLECMRSRANTESPLKPDLSKPDLSQEQSEPATQQAGVAREMVPWETAEEPGNPFSSSAGEVTNLHHYSQTAPGYHGENGMVAPVPFDDSFISAYTYTYINDPYQLYLAPAWSTPI